MKNSLIQLIVFLLVSCYYYTPCSGQKVACNNKAVDASVKKKVPKGICIPAPLVINEVLLGSDFDSDGKKDVVVGYGEYPAKNGQKQFYSFFKRINDTTFTLIKQLPNIRPPFVDNIYAAAAGQDSTLVRLYPLDASVEIKNEKIFVSHLIPQSFGKTYEFKFDPSAKDWLLERTKYWIGNMDERDVERMDLSKKLINKNVLEEEIPKVKISIDRFDLKESKKRAYSEEKSYLSNKYDLFEWSSKNK